MVIIYGHLQGLHRLVVKEEEREGGTMRVKEGEGERVGGEKELGE